MFEFLLPTPFSTIWSKNICLRCLKISGMGPLVRWGPLVRLGSCVTWTSHGFDPRSTNCARWCEDSTRGILAWKRCEDPNKLGGQKPCSFFLEQKISREKKGSFGEMQHIFQWMVSWWFCFLAWKVCTNWNRGPLSRVKGWIHKVSLNPCLLVRKLHIKHNNHLPQNFWYTDSTPPAFSHKWKISPKDSHLYYQKKVPKIELPHTRLEPGSCIFGTFFLPKKLLKTTAGCEKPPNQSEPTAFHLRISF